MFANDLNSLDVRAMDPVPKLSDKLDDGYTLPFHVRAIEVEAGHVGVTRFVQRRQVIGGRFDIAHGPLAGVTLQVESDAVLLTGVENRLEAFDQQFEAYRAHVRDRMAAEAGRQRWEE